MARLPLKLCTLPGSPRARSIEINYGLSDPEGVRSWEADSSPAGGGRYTNYYGQPRGEVSRYNRRMMLKGVKVAQENWHHIRSWRDQAEPLTLSPLWSRATAGTVNTVLPLGKPAPGEGHLQDFLIADKRSEVDFTRYSRRFHPDTGEAVEFHVPLYTDGWKGEQANIGDVIHDTNFPSFEYRAYVDRDAVDVGSITRVYLDPRWDADKFIVGQLVCIQTRELSTNYFEIARVDAKSAANNYLDLSQTTVADAVCTNTSEYTFAQGTSISNNLCPDGDMSDSGVGTWSDRGAPILVEKTDTMNEIGTRALRVIGDGNDTGAEVILGEVPAGTDLVVMVRVDSQRGSAVVNLRDDTTGIDHTMGAAVTGWQWIKYCVEINRGGAGQKEVHLQFFQSGVTEAEMIVQRVEIYENEQDNGGFEPEVGDTFDFGDNITPNSTDNTVYGAAQVQDTVGPWDLSLGIVGLIAVAAGGSYGRVSGVNDGTDTVTVDSWIGGIPANGELCNLRQAEAPGWNDQSMEPTTANYLTQDIDSHSGTYAQGAIADQDSEGFTSAVSSLTSGEWYYIGSYLKMASGSVQYRETGGAAFSQFAFGDYLTYGIADTILRSTVGGTIQVKSTGGAAEWLTDDFWVIRLMGNPYENGEYDLPEQLDTDGYTIFWTWVPDVANGAYPAAAANNWTISRREFDATNRVFASYVPSTTTMQFTNTSTASGADNSDIATTTFSAGDKIHMAMKVDGGTGAMKSWRKINQDAASTGTGAGATIAAGLTRLFLRAGPDDEYHFNCRGALSGITVVNEIMADADIEEVLEIMAGDTGYEQDLTLLEETYGIIYEIEPNGITPWHPADGEYITCDIALREVGRIGAFRNAY